MDYERAVPQRLREWFPTRGQSLARFTAGMDDVVMLGYGDIGFVTPEHIREAAKQAIDAGKTRYDYLPELRQAIANKLKRDNDIEADPNKEIIVSAGCHAILFQIFATFVGVMGDKWTMLLAVSSFVGMDEAVKIEFYDQLPGDNVIMGILKDEQMCLFSTNRLRPIFIKQEDLIVR